MCAPPVCLPPMWLRLQARTIHARLPRRRPFPGHPKFLPTFSAAAAAATPERCSSDRIRGYSRSHISGCTSDVCASGVLASGVAAPAGADNSRQSSPPKALPQPFRKSFRLSPRLQPQPHRRDAHSTESAATAAATSVPTLPMCVPPACLPPMWLRLQARTIHARPPRRRPFPGHPKFLPTFSAAAAAATPERCSSDRIRGYSRSHISGCTSDVCASGVLASGVAAPAGADNSRPSSPPKALTQPIRNSFRLSPRQQPQPHRRAAHPTESAATAAATSFRVNPPRLPISHFSQFPTLPRSLVSHPATFRPSHFSALPPIRVSWCPFVVPTG